MRKVLTSKELVNIVLNSFEAERTNNVTDGLSVLATDFKKTSMVVSNDILFPQISGAKLLDAINAAYSVQGREFYVFNTAANELTQTVFVELAEREPRSDATVLWPYTLVCQFKNGKIAHTRHYGDPALLREHLNLEQIQKVVME